MRVHINGNAASAKRLLARTLISIGLGATLVSVATAQDNASTAALSSVIRGRVLDADARPISDAVIFVLETLQETRSDADGAFLLRSSFTGPVTIAARKLGFQPSAIDLKLPVDTTLTLTLKRQPPTLNSIAVVAAGEYTLGSGTTATLSPLEVAQTPGAAANVARAIQTLPGVQNVDEGTGLFVRGGDVSETRVLIDDATFLSPVRFENPTGHITSSVDPFLLDRTVFSAGGFGAQHGNALSGLVRMETAARPTRTGGTVTASIGSLGGALAWSAHPRLGLRASAKRSSLEALNRAFGEAQPFEPAPRGDDASGSIEWQSSSRGRIRVFGLTQQNEFGVGGAALAGNTAYAADSRQSLAVLSWRDSSFALRPAVSIGRSSFTRAEQVAGYAFDTRLTDLNMVASLAWIPRDGMQIRGGVEFERLDTRYRGAPSVDSLASPDFDARPRLDREAVWGEVMYETIHGLRTIVGVRRDAANLGAAFTVDPRVSLAWTRGRISLTAALGRYAQTAEPTFFRPNDPSDRFTPMRVDQGILGAQLGGDTLGLRVELYEKRYSGLWQFDRAFEPAADGRGRARGLDALFKWQPFPSTSTRVTWSSVQAERTDPNTGTIARAVGDLSHSVTWVTETRVRTWTIGTARRWAAGRPFTDIVGSTPGPDGPEPVFGAANAAQMPAYGRFDLSVSWYRGLGSNERGLVVFIAASNVFDRNNVMRYRWNSDFTSRTPVRAPFNRSVYAGATLLF